MSAPALIPPRKSRWRRLALGGLALVLFLALGVVFALRSALEAGRFTPRILASLQAHTGYHPSLGGLGLTFGGVPKLALRDVALAVPGSDKPGLMAPEMRLSFGLFALLRGVVDITSIEADGVILALDPALWALPTPGQAQATGRPGDTHAPRVPGTRLRIGQINLRDATLLLPGAPQRRIDIPRLSVAEISSTSPSDVVAAWRFGGLAFTLEGKAGPLLGLAPGQAPLLGAMTIKAGAGDLGSFWPGLRLEGLEITAPPGDVPARLSGAFSRAGSTARLEAQIGALQGLLLTGPEAPLPLEASLSMGTARLGVKGAVAQPRKLASGQFDLSLSVPDAAALGGFVALPSGLAASARITWRDLSQISLTRFDIAHPALQAAGALDLSLAGKPGLSGRVAVARLDLAGFAGAAPAAAPPSPAPGTAPRPGNGRVIPDLALPVAGLRGFDADISFSIAELIAGTQGLRDLQTQLRLRDGTLQAEPLALTLPAGRLAGSLGMNAAPSPAQFRLALRSQPPGLDLSAAHEQARALGIRGLADLALDVHGTGDSTRAIVGSLTGQAGIAVANGRLESGILLNALGEMAALLSPGGQRLSAVELRCLALGFVAEQGVARSQALLMDTSIGTVSGSALLNLREETLAGRLFADLRLRGLALRAPIGLGGSFAQPRLGLESEAALGQAMAGLLADQLARRPGLEGLSGALRGGEARNEADCAGQLRLARLGVDGAVPPPRPAAPEAPATNPATPALPPQMQDLLRGLGGILGGSRR